MKTYEEMLDIAKSSTNCWNEESWKKILKWLQENKQPIDLKTIRKLTTSYDDFETIKFELGF